MRFDARDVGSGFDDPGHVVPGQHATIFWWFEQSLKQIVVAQQQVCFGV